MSLWVMINTALALAAAPSQEFLKACQATPIKTCSKLNKLLFSGRGPVHETSPSTFKAPALPVDRSLRFIVLQDLRQIAAFTHCFNVFNGWTDPEKISIEQDAANVTGIYAHWQAEYANWLKTAAGQKCSKRVKDWSGLEVVRLNEQLAGRRALVILHPTSWLRRTKSEKDFNKLAVAILNHERMHAYQFGCKQVDDWAPKFWDSLSEVERKRIQKKCPRAQWNERLKAVSEGIACYFHDQPQEILRYARECSF